MLKKLDQFCKTYFPDNIQESTTKRQRTTNNKMSREKAVSEKAVYTLRQSSREGLSEKRLYDRIIKVESVIAALEAEKLSPESIRQFKAALKNMREEYYKTCLKDKDDLTYSYSQVQIDRLQRISGLSLRELYHESQGKIHIIPIKIGDSTFYYDLEAITEISDEQPYFLEQLARDLYNDNSNSDIIDLLEFKNLALEFSSDFKYKFLELKLLNEKLHYFEAVTISSSSPYADEIEYVCDYDISNLPEALRVPTSNMSKLKSLVIFESNQNPFKIPLDAFNQLKQHPNLISLYLGHIANDFKNVTSEPLESVQDVELLTTNKKVDYQTIAKLFPNAEKMSLGIAADLHSSDLDAVLSLPHLQELTLRNTSGYYHYSFDYYNLFNLESFPKLDLSTVIFPKDFQQLVIEFCHDDGDDGEYRSKLSQDLLEQVINLAEANPHVVIVLKNLKELPVTEFRNMCPNTTIDNLNLVENLAQQDETLNWHLGFSDGKIVAIVTDQNVEVDQQDVEADYQNVEADYQDVEADYQNMYDDDDERDGPILR